MAVDERSEVRFSIPQGTLPWQPILWTKSRPNPQNWVRVRFGRWRRTTRIASAALDAGEPVNWPIIYRRLGDSRAGYSQAWRCVTVSQKTRHQTLGHNFSNYYPIFKILSLADSVVNLQQIPPRFKHVATLPCEIRMQKNGIILKYVLQLGLVMNHKVV